MKTRMNLKLNSWLFKINQFSKIRLMLISIRLTNMGRKLSALPLILNLFGDDLL